jgi:ankyrin repeat protein
MAALAGKQDVVKFLLEVRPELLRIVDANGWNALHRAVLSGNLAIVTALVTAGLDINTPVGEFADCLQLVT